MATFTVQVTQSDIGYVKVEANSRHEAKELAVAAHFKSETEWVDGTLDFKIAPDQKEDNA